MQVLSTSFREGIDDIIELKTQVEQLPPRQKAVVGLLVAGYNQQTSGEILGITRVAVGLLYKKALVKLRNGMSIKDGT